MWDSLFPSFFFFLFLYFNWILDAGKKLWPTLVGKKIYKKSNGGCGRRPLVLMHFNEREREKYVIDI